MWKEVVQQSQTSGLRSGDAALFKKGKERGESHVSPSKESGVAGACMCNATANISRHLQPIPHLPPPVRDLVSSSRVPGSSSV